MNEVRRIRTAVGMTQRELAERSGVAQPNIAAYEAGRRMPSGAMLERLRTAARPRPSQVLHEHRDELLALARRYHATDVKVFGSIARGEDTPDSDVDLLVTFEDGASAYDYGLFIEDAEELLGRHVDVVSIRALRDGHRITREAVAV